MTTFKKAVRSQSKLRFGISGTAGAGKSYTSLLVAKGLAQGGRIAAIDTENGSLAKYSDAADFDVSVLSDFNPKHYVAAIQEAAAAGYSVLVIDSLSHAWAGKGGVLEAVSEATAKSKSRNSYMAWRDGTPLQNSLVDAIIQSPIHVIFTMRSKTAYEQEKDDSGKLQVRRIGLAPVQREGIEYEADVVGEMDDGNMTIVKSRYSPLHGKLIRKPGEALGIELGKWLSDAPALPNPQPAPDRTSDVYTLRMAIAASTTMAELLEVAKEVKAEQIDGVLNGDDVKILRAHYANKEQQLSAS